MCINWYELYITYNARVYSNAHYSICLLANVLSEKILEADLQCHIW